MGDRYGAVQGPESGRGPDRRHRPRSQVPALLQTGAAWSWRLVAVAAAVAVVGYVMSQLMTVVVALVVGLLIARALTPAVGWLCRRGVPRLAATWTTLVGTFAALGGIAYWIVPQAIDEFSELDDLVLEAVDDIREWLVQGPFGVSEGQIDRAVQTLIDELQQNAGTIASGVVGGTQTILQFLVGILLAIVLGFFLTRDSEKIFGWFAGIGGTERRDDLRVAGRRAWAVLGGYLLGAVIEGAVEATLVTLGLWIMGVPLVFPLGVLIFFSAFFPVIGPLAAGAVAALVALVSGGFVDGIIVAAIVTVVNQLTGNLLMPYVMGRTIDVHPAVILLAVVVGGLVAGIAGAFLAVPLIGILIKVSQALHERGAAPGNRDPALTDAGSDADVAEDARSHGGGTDA